MRAFIHSVILLSASALSSTARGQQNVPAPDRQTSAQSAAAGFLRQHCVECHGESDNSSDMRLDTLRFEFSAAERDTLNLVRYKILSGEMPPPEKPRPNASSQQRLVDWLAKRLREKNVKLLEPDGLFLPKNGNLIDHATLFNRSIKTLPATRSRIWRMSPQAYDSLMKGELAKSVRGVSQPFGELSSHGLKDYAAAFAIDEPTTAQLLRNAEAIVASQTRGEWVDGKWQTKGYPKAVKEFVTLFAPNNQPPSLEEKQKAIGQQFRLTLQREPTPGELDRYITLMDQTSADTDLRQGVRTALTAVLMSPEAVYRFEVGSGKVDAAGRRLLAPRELAYAIAFALTDRRPDGDLLRAAHEGKLNSAKDVAREVRRILESEKVSKPRVMRFFRQYFGYHRARDVFKDAKLNPHHRAEDLVRDTDHLVQWVLDRDQDVFRTLLTTNKSFVNMRIDPKRGPTIAQAKNLLHTSYGLPLDWKWTPNQPIDLPREERAGILTQPSWLVAHSGNFDNHPILRGKWIQEHLLGGTIPDLPITVDAQLPEEPEHTLRHRMQVTREEYCWNCHARMNPMGLTFEIFDHFGRFRTRQKILDLRATTANVDSKGNPKGDVLKLVSIDASGAIDGQRFENAVDMIHALAQSARSRQMFVRYAFRYFLGRNEELSDSMTLIRADTDYVQSGGSFKSLVQSLLTSDSFLYRMD